jgi:hypothetical protein
MLVERAGQVVSRDEIREHIWDANTFVDFERSINFAINQIRLALGDAAEKPRFVETIPRHGYRFLCPVEVSEAPPVEAEANAAQSTGSAGGHASPALVTPVTGTRWKSRKWLVSGLGFALLVILAGIFMNGHYSLRMHRPWIVKAGGVAHTVTLTNVRGLVYSPVFSPDGKKIAFFWNGPRSKQGRRLRPSDRRRTAPAIDVFGGETYLLPRLVSGRTEPFLWAL